MTLTQLGRLLGRLDGLDLLRLTHHRLLNLDLDLLRLLRLLLLLRCRHELVVHLLHLLNLLNLLVLLDLDRLVADDLLATSVVQNYSLTTDHDLLTGRGHYLLYNLLSTSALIDHDLLRCSGRIGVLNQNLLLYGLPGWSCRNQHLLRLYRLTLAGVLLDDHLLAGRTLKQLLQIGLRHNLLYLLIGGARRNQLTTGGRNNLLNRTTLLIVDDDLLGRSGHLLRSRACSLNL